MTPEFLKSALVADAHSLRDVDAQKLAQMLAGELGVSVEQVRRVMFMTMQWTLDNSADPQKLKELWSA